MPLGGLVGIWDVAFGYTALRTVLAVGLGMWTTRHGRAIASVMAQGASDLAAAGVLTACVDYRIRESLGLWALLLAAYVIAWEAWSFTRGVVEASHDDAVPDETASDAAGVGRLLWALWRGIFVLPVVMAALLLSFTILYPNSLRLPSERPAIQCLPPMLDAADTLTIEMVVPHGGELLVTNPAGRTLVVVPFARAGTPTERRFERQPTLRLPVTTARAVAQEGKAQRIFDDSGTYIFQVNELPDVSGSLLCRARFSVPASAAPPPTR